jgi:hypothetical protein
MMIKSKGLKGGQWQKNEGGKLQQRPNVTFDILMAKYKEGRAGVRGHENRTIQNTKPDSLVSLGQARASIRGCENQTIQNAKPDSPVSLGQANTSTAGGSSGKWSWTPSRQSMESQDRRQQDHHRTPYFPVGPSMPGRWRPPPMTYPPCPPWAGWYGLWAPPPMPFHPGWSGHAEGFSYGGFYAGDGRHRYPFKIMFHRCILHDEINITRSHLHMLFKK